MTDRNYVLIVAAYGDEATAAADSPITTLS